MATKVEVKSPEQRKQHTPLWKRRLESLRRSGTTARDIFEQDIFQTKMNAASRDHVRLIWMSDIIMQKRPLLTGFNYELLQPCTPEVCAEFGIETRTKDRTPEGVPKAGMDAVLYWAPEELCREQDAFLRRGADVKNLMAAREKGGKEEIAASISSEQRGMASPIGSITASTDGREFLEAEAREESSVGAPLVQEE
jgi:hypothetical protein